jgi:hypothetical protein
MIKLKHHQGNYSFYYLAHSVKSDIRGNDSQVHVVSLGYPQSCHVANHFLSHEDMERIRFTNAHLVQSLLQSLLQFLL